MALQAIDAPDFDHLFKVLLIGDSGTGKSNILLRFADDRFKEDIGSTIGVDFKVCTRHVQGKVIKMYLWDTAGQERFRTITSSYYRGSHGIVVAYDITERVSFEHVRMWIQEIVKYANNSVKVMLVGNKTDLAEKRAVSTDEGFLLAEELGVRFLETSALSARNVENAFGLLIQDMVAAACMERPLSQQHQSLGLKDGKSSVRPGQAVCCV